MTRRTMSAAAPFSTPVARPFASRTISPLGGFGVASVMSASLSATLFARYMLRSKRFTNTGCSGVSASTRSRLGVNGPGAEAPEGCAPADPAAHCSYAPHSPLVIHAPFGSRPAASLIRAANAFGSWTSSRFTPTSRAPVLSMCTCASLKPGDAKAPLRSITFVPVVVSFCISAVDPTATMRVPGNGHGLDPGPRCIEGIYPRVYEREIDRHPRRPLRRHSGGGHDRKDRHVPQSTHHGTSIG